MNPDIRFVSMRGRSWACISRRGFAAPRGHGGSTRIIGGHVFDWSMDGTYLNVFPNTMYPYLCYKKKGGGGKEGKKASRKSAQQWRSIEQTLESCILHLQSWIFSVLLQVWRWNGGQGGARQFDCILLLLHTTTTVTSVPIVLLCIASLCFSAYILKASSISVSAVKAYDVVQHNASVSCLETPTTSMMCCRCHCLELTSPRRTPILLTSPVVFYETRQGEEEESLQKHVRPAAFCVCPRWPVRRADALRHGKGCVVFLFCLVFQRNWCVETKSQ